MSDLEKFVHNEALQLPHLIKITIARYQFKTIHPFLDGNGRLGRLMIAIYLAGFGLLHKPALYLSVYFERHKTGYVDHFMAVRQKHKMKEWLVFFLYGVRETAQHSIQVFKDILTLKARIEHNVLPTFSRCRLPNAQTLLRHLYQVLVVNIKSVAKLLNLQPNTATDLINDFVKHGILSELTGKQRNRLFWFKEYISVFKRQRGE